jgi:signal peptidase I
MGRANIGRVRRLAIVGFLAALVAGIVIVGNVVFETVQVSGDVMSPTIKGGDYVSGTRLGSGPVRRGDIVTFHTPAIGSGVLIKRVVGLPGERIRIADGVVYADDRPVAEHYLKAGGWTQQRDWTPQPQEGQVASGYFVLNDNRELLSDSRSFGPVPRGWMVSRLFQRDWPLPAPIS